MKLKTALKVILRQYGFVTYPFLTVLGGGFLFYFFPFHFFPDFIDIKNYPKIYELFSLIISSLVSLISIYITVSIVAYEFFKQKSGIDFHKSFLINRISAYFISFTVLTIIGTFFCSVFISSSNPNYNEVSVIYFNVLLFIFVIAFLFPVAFNLFSSLKPEKLAYDELQKINRETIFIKVVENGDIDKQAELFENDHLVKVESIVIALIAVSDNIKANAIIQKTTLKLSNLIIDEENKRDKEYIVVRLISFFIKIIDFSLLQPNNTAILRSIWNAVDGMYSVIITRKETVKHYEKFRKVFFEKYFNRLLENNKEERIFEGIIIIRKIIQKQVLFNMADDKKIYHFNSFRITMEKDFIEPENYTDEDYKNAGHWHEVAIETMECFSFLINKAIKLNQPDLLNKCFEQINELNFKLHLKRVGVYKQCFLYISSANTICDYAYRAFEKNVFTEGSDAKFLTPSKYENLIVEKHPAARTVLQKYCYLLINLQQINKLDRWFLGGLSIGAFITSLGELGGIAKQCAIKFKESKEIQECLDDCISTYKILKEYYEKNPPENFGLYSVIKWQFNNILEWLEIEKVEDKRVIDNLKNIISSFKEK